MSTTDHTLTMTFQDGQVYGHTMTLNCHAAADAFCHAVWDCECEAVGDFDIVNGRPQHADAWGDDEVHIGRFDPEACVLRDWREAAGEDVFGTVTVPVRPVYEDDYVEFDVTPAPETEEADR